MNEVPVSKEGRSEAPVPPVWRPTLAAIVDALARKEEPMLPQVKLQLPGTWDDIQENIEDYGDRLVSLPDAAWDSSVHIWSGEYWDVLVDLYTEEESASDLVLKVRVYETADGYRYVVDMAYVP